MADTKSIMDQLGGQGKSPVQFTASSQMQSDSQPEQNAPDETEPDYTDALMASLSPQQKKKDNIR